MDEKPHTIWHIRDRSAIWGLIRAAMSLAIDGEVKIKISGGKTFFNDVELPQSTGDTGS